MTAVFPRLIVLPQGGTLVLFLSGDIRTRHKRPRANVGASPDGSDRDIESVAELR